MDNTLYIKDNAGHLRYWTVREAEDGLEIEHGVVGGTPQFQYEEISYGKGGRDQDEQIESRIQSRINKQLQKGYIWDIEKARVSKPMNQLGFHKPMLAKKERDVNIPLLRTKTIFTQRKLDGNRCLIHNDGVKLTAYTRNGKPINTIGHIMKELDGIIPEGCTLDGELYLHGTMLQTLVSWIKRYQPNTLKVQYHVYDLISDEPFSVRSKRLGAILSRLDNKANYPIKLVETTEIEPDSPEDLSLLFKEARKEDYEGLMVRSDYKIVRGELVQCGYEDGKRSGSLIKFKGWESEEFRVIDIIPSRDGWARCVCEWGRGSEAIRFTVSVPGNMTFKYFVMNNKEKFIGKKLTCDFAYWTADGVPFHPTAVAFRDYE